MKIYDDIQKKCPLENLQSQNFLDGLISGMSTRVMNDSYKD